MLNKDIIPFAFFKLIFNFFGCAGSSTLQGIFSGRSAWGLLSRWSTQASHCSDFSCCRARALDMQLWLPGAIAQAQ